MIEETMFGRLFGDLKSPALLHLKGWLFFALGLLAAGLLLWESPGLRTIALLAICVWAFCRWYYFLFYVIERYAGGERYAGLFDYFKRNILAPRSVEVSRPRPTDSGD